MARTGRSLHHPNYRRFASGHAISVCGTWIQRVAQDWLVLELTGSAVAIGVATALQFLPVLLFGMLGGVLVDRVDRWKLIVATQVASGLLAAVLAAVTLGGHATVGVVYLLALLLGLVTVVDSPARHTFVSDLVPSADYVNAQALNSTVHNAGRLVGPALGGGLIAAVGAGPAFAINAVSFVAVVVSLARIDRSALHPRERAPRARGQVVEGLGYAWRRPELRAALLLVAVVGVFGQNFRVVLPITASEVLGGDAALYGWLTAALGLGAMLGSVGAASQTTVSGRSLLAWTVAFGVVNLGAALIGSLVAALVAMVALGVSNILFNTAARTLIQLRSTPTVQGRVMALHGLLFLGSTPVGGPVSGWVCEVVGSPWAYVMAAGTALAAAAVTWPALRRADHTGTDRHDVLPSRDDLR